MNRTIFQPRASTWSAMPRVSRGSTSSRPARQAQPLVNVEIRVHKTYRNDHSHVCSAAAQEAPPAAQVPDDEDLMQFADRYKWYEAKFAADDMPDWTAGSLVSVAQQGAGVRLVTLLVEVSRERVPLRNAYKAAGQMATLRVNGGEARSVPVASGPPPGSLNVLPLYHCKGDQAAGEGKIVREPSSVMAPVSLLVSRADAPDLYDISDADLVSVGPFTGTGLDMRSSGVQAAFRFPTIVIFAAGPGIATAAALLESPPGCATHLAPALRGALRLYYAAPHAAAMALTDRYDAWSASSGVVVVPAPQGFADAWDGDDSLTYEPETTAAFILTGGDEEAEAAALELCREAEIDAIVRDSVPAQAPVFLDSTSASFMRFRRVQKTDSGAAVADEAGDGAGGESSEDLAP